jgi:SOS response regulatory protein OraA/RecX
MSRLKESGAIDDSRVAEAIARSLTAVKHRGRLRVKQKMASAGIPASIASRAIDQVFGTLNEDELIEAAIQKRLRGRTIEDDAGLRRIYRFLAGQGFEHDRIMRAIRKHRA